MQSKGRGRSVIEVVAKAAFLLLWCGVLLVEAVRNALGWKES